MNEQVTPQKKVTPLRALLLLVGLIGLLQLSFWSDQRSFEVEGPSRIIKGPQNTLYIQIDRKIAKVSAAGDVLQVVDLDGDLALPEHVADFFVEEDGSLLIARKDSQLLQYYSPEGKLIRTHGRIPSPLAEGNHYCKFSKDQATGILYFADTSHHRIQIYGPDEKEVNTIIVPSGSSVATIGSEGSSKNEQQLVASADTPLHYPNGLLFETDRLIATDTGNSRLLILYPIGSLEKVIPVNPGNSFGYSNPIKVTRSGDAVYAVVRGQDLLGGTVVAFDLASGEPRPFMQQNSIDPWDVFAMTDEVLVADRTSLSVLRFKPTGEYISVFGQSSLQDLFAERQIARKTYQWLRIGSLAGMVIILIALLLASRKQRIAHETAGASLYTPVGILQRALGPMGGIRRNILLVVIPGIGQAAAGRILRACTVLAVMLFFGAIVVFSWLQYREAAALQLSLHVTVVLLFYTVWIIAALDGVRISGKTSEGAQALTLARFLTAVLSPLLTVLVAVIAQLIREMVMRSNPGISMSIQMLFRSIMSVSGGSSSSFSAMIPATLIFGWGGAAAGMFSSIALQARMSRGQVLLGLIAGMFAGLASWSITTYLAGNKLGWLFYIDPVQGAVLGALAYLFFRSAGMPLLVIPVAIAGAWTGDLFRMIVNTLPLSLRHLLPVPLDAFWTGALARLDLLLLPAFFIHLAIWVAWNTATPGPVGRIPERVVSADPQK